MPPDHESVSREDVVWCYRTLLGREPESEAVIDWHSRAKSFRELVEHFAGSAEFRANLGAARAPKHISVSQDIVRILRDSHRVCSLEVSPADSSPLFLRNDRGTPIKVHLPNDSVIGHFALLNQHWDIGKPKFVQHVAATVGNHIVLVDVGANVGLFSRQSFSLSPGIAALHAYEPHPGNFDLLCRNLEGMERARLNNFGLGNATSTLNFYLDPDNAGNYSLNVNAMPTRFERTSVAIVRAADEEDKWLAHEQPIFYKSDTQGFDETIATSLSSDFWNNVCGGVLELWRIPGKEYDVDKFARIIDRFDNKVFESKPKSNVSSLEIMEYLRSSDHQFDDLLFWR